MRYAVCQFVLIYSVVSEYATIKISDIATFYISISAEFTVENCVVLYLHLVLYGSVKIVSTCQLCFC